MRKNRNILAIAALSLLTFTACQNDPMHDLTVIEIEEQRAGGETSHSGGGGTPPPPPGDD